MDVRRRLVLGAVAVSLLFDSMGCTVTEGAGSGASPKPEPGGLTFRISTTPSSCPGTADSPGPRQQIVLDDHRLMVPPRLRFPRGSKVVTTYTKDEELTIVLNAPRSRDVLEHFKLTSMSVGYNVWLGDDKNTEVGLDGCGWRGSVKAAAAGTTVVKFSPAVPDRIRASSLKLVNLPYFLNVPANTKPASIDDPVTGASVRFARPAPRVVLRFYRDSTGALWDLVSDTTTGQVTTLVLVDSDGWTATVTTTPTTATLTTRRP